ncbi:hypothetical protein SAMN02745166_02889 [Prosthecobacter debontii]|uniref:Uncharacterized protein n=1 Tax=Prosthecobacter debontii TaxID=48467 RepID=A0A1T4YBR7_9BACT|nr:hypothetical protein [Prosthecobacter debontii]SKA99272.1 hypothetical protein SAMN02745166_02889 [Prosthecobacter debontii]
MEPLSPNDPLWKVLGQTKRVEVRPNFTQNVVRMARQTPQDRGWLARLKSWWQEKQEVGTAATWTWAAAAAAIALTASAVLFTPAASEESSANLAAVTNPAPVPISRAEIASVEKAEPASTVATAEVDFPLMPGFETEWQNLEQMGDLLAVHDTSLLTDSEINLLFY